MKIRIITGMALIAIGLWLASLIAPALPVDRNGGAPGIMLLLLGWISAVSLQFGWFANIFFLFSIVVFLPWSRTSNLKIGVLIAGDVLPVLQTPHFFKTWCTGQCVGPGVYLWAASMILMALSLGLKIAHNASYPQEATKS